MKLRKRALFMNLTDYLGHVINPVRLEVANQTTGAIRERKVRTTGEELCSYMRRRNVFRWFFPNFARFMSPLYKRLKKTQDRKLGPLNDEELTALETLKEKLISLPVFTMSKRNEQHTLDTDVCKQEFRRILLQ